MVEERFNSEKLAQMHDTLWKCVLQFANFSATQERQRIARDLHDSLGHALTALNFQLQTAMQLCEPDPNQAQEYLHEAHNLVKLATSEVRQSVKALRDDEFESKSLKELVDFLVNNFHQTTGILPTVEINLLVALPKQFTVPIYRIIQEALNNIRKYANATEVGIEICTTPTQAYVIVQDNGKGFDPEQVCGGYGLKGMGERVEFLSGEFNLDSQPGEGCCISVEIPLAEIPLKDGSSSSVGNSVVTNVSNNTSNNISNNISNHIPNIDSSAYSLKYPVDKHRADAKLYLPVNTEPTELIDSFAKNSLAKNSSTNLEKNSQIMSEITIHADVSINEEELSAISEDSTQNDDNQNNENQSNNSSTKNSSTTNSPVISFEKPVVYIGEWQPLDLN